MRPSGGVRDFVVGQAGPIKIGTGENRQVNISDVPSAKFVNEAKQILPAIEITASDEYMAGG